MVRIDFCAHDAQDIKAKIKFQPLSVKDQSYYFNNLQSGRNRFRKNSF